MSLFAKAQQATQNMKVEEKDTLGGSFTVPSDVYKGGIKMAYLDAWASGALYVGFEFALLVDGKERVHKEMITISNKAGSFTYTDKQGDAVTMPGYVMVDSILRAATGKGFADQTPVVKGVKMYDSAAKAEVIKEREVFMEAVGKKLNIAILEQEVDKTAKDPVSGTYVPTGETRKENVVSKVFDFDTNKTISEIKAGAEAKFCNDWVAKYKGQVVNKVKGNKAGAAGTPQAQAGAPTVGALFG